MDKGGLMLSGGQCRRKHTKTSEQTALSPAWEVPKLQRGNGYTGVWADVAVDRQFPPKPKHSNNSNRRMALLILQLCEASYTS